MADVFGKHKRSQVMAHIRATNTRPELRVRSALHKAGFRFSLHSAKLPGKPDLVLPKYRTVIQVRGCFWHCHNCLDGHIPKSHRDYWLVKLQNNRRRDARNDRLLRRRGWSVLVVWECRCRTDAALAAQVRRISRLLRRKV